MAKEIANINLDPSALQKVLSIAAAGEDVGDDAGEDETSPSRTNGLIRDLLRRIPKATYIAYTATPFANVLIDPDAVDRAIRAFVRAGGRSLAGVEIYETEVARVR